MPPTKKTTKLNKNRYRVTEVTKYTV